MKLQSKFAKVISLILALCMVLSAFGGLTLIANAEDAAATTETEIVTGILENGLVYSIENGEATMTGYKGKAVAVVIPSEIDGATVTTIGEKAFYYCTGIPSIEIPSSVKLIKTWAFAGCKKLKSVTIPDGVEKLSAYAFYDCQGLTEIKIADSVTAIMGCVFSDCINLKSVTFPENIEIIQYSLFLRCTALESVVLPSKVTQIANKAFDGCTALKTVNFKGTEEEWNAITVGTSNGVLSNVEVVFNYGAHEHEYVATVTEPTCQQGGFTTYTCTCGDSYIDDITEATDHSYVNGACENCGEAEEVITEWFYEVEEGKAIITGCANPSVDLVIPDNIDGYTVGGIAPYAFQYAEIRYVSIPSTVQTIGEGAFQGSCIESIEIPDSVWHIGSRAFMDCGALTMAIIPASATNLNGETFKNCYALSMVDISGGIENLSQEEFLNCGNLSEIYLPETLTYIGENCFDLCSSLKTVYFNGTSEQWANVSISEIGNSDLSKAEIVCNDGPVHEHNYVVGTVIAPNCTTPGCTLYTCTGCGQSYESDFTNALGHEYAQNVVDPTCTDDGYTEHYCLKCDERYTDNYLPSFGHKFNSLGICESCGIFDDYGSTHTHVYTLEVFGATCTEQGYTIYTCYCGDTYTDNFVDALGHTLEVIEEAQGDCVNPGYRVEKCRYCDYEEITHFELADHSYTTEVVAPTCTEEGYTRYTCSVCGHSYDSEFSVMIDHNFEYTETVEPTGSTQGYSVYTCTMCGATEHRDFYDGTWNYRDSAEGVKLLSYSHPVGTLVSPYKIDGSVVTTLGARAFYNKDELTSFTFHTIGEFAQINSEAFYDCNGLTEITLYPNLTTIADSAFYNCTSLEKVIFMGSAEQWAAINIYPFGNDALLQADIVYNGEYHQHTYDVFVFEATCTENGYTTYTCTGCGYEYTTDWTYAAPHEYEDTYVDATCTEQGYTLHTCVNCGKTYKSDYIDAWGHDWAPFEIHPATCTEQGYTTYVCGLCEEQYNGDFVDAIGHDIYHEITEASCTDYGYDYEMCNNCGILSVTRYDRLGHNYVEEIILPDCTNQGYTAHRCSRCGDYYENDFVAANGHVYEATIYNPTCTDAGYTLYQCSCGASYTTDFVMGAHSYEIAEIIDPTCYEPGYTLYSCTVCGESFRDDYISPFHSYVPTEHAATCYDAGYTQYDCIVCGKYYRENYVDPQHSYDETIVEPTCTAQGYTELNCSVCGNIEKVDFVTAKGHWYDAVITEPTCEQSGFTTYTCLNGCGYSYVDNYVDNLVHSFETTIVEGACGSEGYTQHTCIHCGYTYTDNYVYIDHNYGSEYFAPTCTEWGYEIYTCIHCGDSYRVDVEEPKHAYSQGDFHATCTEAAHSVFTCRYCGYTYTEYYGEPTGHNYGFNYTSPATCKEGAKDHYVCSGCGDSYEILVSEPNRHEIAEEILTQVSCAQDGKARIYCANCDYEIIVTHPAYPHALSVTIVNETCTEQGYEITSCANCDYESIRYIEALGGEHEYVSTTYEATCMMPGYTYYECTRCGDWYDEVFADPTDHKVVDGVCEYCGMEVHEHSYVAEVTEPTCQEGGFTTYTCSCGYSYVDDLTDVVDHKWFEAAGQGAECTEDGITIYGCEYGCGAEKEEVIPALGHSMYFVEEVEPTCQQGGYMIFRCQNCDYEETGKDTGTVDHKWYLGATQDPTCTEQGVKIYNCEFNCGSTYEETVEATGHDMQFTKTVAATKDAQGYDLYTCANCGETEKKNFVDYVDPTPTNKVSNVVVNATDVDFTVTWDAFKNATGYYIRVRDAANTKNLVGPINIKNGATTSYTFNAANNKLEYETDYIFQVTAYVGNTYQKFTEADAIVSRLVIGERVVGLKAEIQGKGALVTFLPVENAEGYYAYVYEADTMTRVDSKELSATATSFTANRNLDAGKKYTVKITPKLNGKWVSGVKENGIGVTFTAPIINPSSYTIADQTATSIRFSWSAVRGVSEYYVRVKEKATGNLVKTIKVTGGKTTATIARYTDGTPLSPETTYTLEFCAYVPGVTPTYSAPIDLTTIAFEDVKVTAKYASSTNTVNISWNTTTNAKAYFVYQISNGKKTLVTYLEGAQYTGYTVTAPAKAGEYTYGIVTVESNTSGKVYTPMAVSNSVTIA